MIRYLVLLSFVCTLPQLALAQDKKAGKWSEEKAEGTSRSLVGNLELEEAEAIRLLEDAAFDKRPKAAYHAVKFLGGIRSVKAVPVLCDRLLYKQKAVFYDGVVGDREDHPATAALVNIGLPAIEGLLLKMTSTKTTQRYRDAAMDVIIEIVGHENLSEEVERFKKQAIRKHRSSSSPDLKHYKDYDRRAMDDLLTEVAMRYRKK
jgi:hypothetical protein